MQELETEITAWRARLMAAMPTRNETVRELETHLRDHIEVQMRRGVSARDAFAAAVKRIGEPRVVAREFERLEPRWFGMWRPTAVVYGLVAAAVLSHSVGLIYTDFGKSEGFVVVGDGLLLRAHVGAIVSGYVAMIGAGMLGGCILVAGWRRTLTQRKQQALRRDLFRLVMLASVLFPLGIGLGFVWAQTSPPFEALSWTLGTGVLTMLIFTWLQLAQFRVVTDNWLRAVLVLVGAAVVGLVWLGGSASTGPVPIAWICGFGILSEAAILFLHSRAPRSSTDAVCE